MIIHIVAHNDQNIIGKSGPESLLWSIPEDMKLFGNLTKGTTIVMGYNTFLSIGKPLPGRKTIVICSKHRHDILRKELMLEYPLEIVRLMTMEEFEEKVATHRHDTFVIVGGEGLYSKFIPNVVYKTVVDFPIEQGSDVQYARYTPDVSKYLMLRSDDLVSKTGVEYFVKCYVKQ